MIKNIIYSIIFHFALFFVLFISIKNFSKENKLREVNISSISLQELQKLSGNNILKEEVKKDSPKPKKNIKEEKRKIKIKKEKPIEEKKQELPKVKKKKIKSMAKSKKITQKDKPVNPKTKTREKKSSTQKEDFKKDNNDKKPKEGIQEDSSKGKNISENQEEIKPEKQAKTLENLDLTLRTKFKIQSQLNRCFFSVFEGVEESQEDIKVEFIMNLSKNGQLIFNEEYNIDQEKYQNNDIYRKITDNVKNLTKKCGYFRNLNIEKYDIWQEFLVNFKRDAKKLEESAQNTKKKARNN